MSRLYPSITQKEPVLFSEIAPAVARGEYNAGVLIHEAASSIENWAWS